MKTTSTMLAALGLLTLTGCASSLAELRESAPLRTAVVPSRSAPELAACAMDGLETGDFTESFAYRLLTRGGVSSVVGSITPAFGGTITPIEATFTPTADGVRVETRGQYGLAGPKIDRAFWPIIERCAGTKVVVVPPLGG